MNIHFRPYVDFETTWQCWGLGVTAFFRRWKRFPCEVFINMGPCTLSFGWRLRHVVDVEGGIRKAVGFGSHTKGL